VGFGCHEVTLGSYGCGPPEPLLWPHTDREVPMKLIWSRSNVVGPRQQRGALGYVLAWLLGVPIPILLLVYLLRGCT
jgi:hypothetical protein